MRVHPDSVLCGGSVLSLYRWYVYGLAFSGRPAGPAYTASPPAVAGQDHFPPARCSRLRPALTTPPGPRLFGARSPTVGAGDFPCHGPGTERGRDCRHVPPPLPTRPGLRPFQALCQRPLAAKQVAAGPRGPATVILDPRVVSAQDVNSSLLRRPRTFSPGDRFTTAWVRSHEVLHPS